MRFSPESRRFQSTVHQLETLLCNIKHNNKLNQISDQHHQQVFNNWLQRWEQNLERFNSSLDRLDEQLQFAINPRKSVPQLSLYRQRGG